MPITQLAEGHDPPVEVAEDQAARDRAEIGNPLTYVNSGGELQTLNNLSEMRMHLWAEFRSVGAGPDGIPDSHVEAALVVWLCLHGPETILPLWYATETIPPVIHEKTNMILVHGRLVRCPLLDRVHLWRDQEFSGDGGKERKESVLMLFKTMINRQGASAMVPDPDADENAPEDEGAEPGKPDLQAVTSTTTPCENSDSQNAKLNGR